MPKFESNYIKNAVAKKNIAEQRFRISATDAKSPTSTTILRKAGLLNHRRLLSPQQSTNRISAN